MGACSYEEWAEVAKRATSDAKQGNHKAREWLTRILVGANPRDKLADSPAAEIARQIVVNIVENKQAADTVTAHVASSPDTSSTAEVPAPVPPEVDPDADV